MGLISRLERLAERHPKWSVALIVIGFFALVTIIASLFFFVGGQGYQIVSSAPIPAVSSSEFYQLVANSTHSPEIDGGKVTVLNNGDGFYPVLYDAIRHAQKNINITWYIWDKGEISSQLHDLLKERLEHGVQVRILLDGLSGRMPDDQRKDLVKAGAVIDDFRNPGIGQFSRIHKRDHRRAVIIDGTIGFTGGMAASDYWLGNAQDKDHWRDIMIQVSGPLVTGLQSVFADLWFRSHGELITGQEFYPAQLADKTTGLKTVNIISSPQADEKILPNLFWLSIIGAQKTLYVATPYFVANSAIYKALEDRAKAGVDVRVLLPGPVTDEKTAWYAGRKHYQELLQAGVKIYEYQPTLMHVKTIMADDVWTVIGSPNIDFHSMEFNEENAFGFQDKNLALKIKSDFENDLTKANQITLGDWNHRNIVERSLELLASLFSKQL